MDDVLLSTIERMYWRMPREFSKKRRTVDGIENLHYRTQVMNGIDDCFISVHNADFIVDFLWWEFDAPSIEKARVVAKRQKERLDQFGIPHLIVFSGSKGFHFYVFTEPWKPPDEQKGNNVLSEIIWYLTDLPYGSEFLDRRSQSRQMIRMVNTINPKTGLYCSYVPDLSRFNPRECTKPTPLPNIIKTINNDIFQIYCDLIPDTPVYKNTEKKLPNIPSSNFNYLGNVIRPCLYHVLKYDRNPLHELRTELVSELMWSGVKKERIIEITKSLNWKDYDKDKNEYQINKIFKKELFPMTCEHIKQYLECIEPHCDYENYPWKKFMRN